MVQWTRFVRYSSIEDPGTIKYGEPILDGVNVGGIAKLAEAGQLKVRQLRGDNPLDAICDAQAPIETVNRLYGPLEAKDVSIIRCIGLNYTTHSQLYTKYIELMSQLIFYL